MPPMNRTNIYIAPGQHERLKEMETADGVSVSERIRRAIDFYLEFEERFTRMEAMVAELYEMHTPGK